MNRHSLPQELQWMLVTKPKEKDLFKHFTDTQLYILKRQAIHASNDITCGAYTREQKDVHTFLLNAIITELRDRAIYHDAQEAGYDKK